MYGMVLLLTHTHVRPEAVFRSFRAGAYWRNVLLLDQPPPGDALDQRDWHRHLCPVEFFRKLGRHSGGVLAYALDVSSRQRLHTHDNLRTTTRNWPFSALARFLG